MAMSGQQQPGNVHHRHHEAVTAPLRQDSSHPSSYTSADIPDEKSRVPPLLEIMSKMWNHVQQCLIVTVAVLCMMWQRFKALISLWCSIPRQGCFKNRRNLSVNAEVDVLAYCSKKWKGEASNITYMRKIINAKEEVGASSPRTGDQDKVSAGE